MDLGNVCIFTEPQQGASYETLLAVALRAEALGFGGFFRSDHYQRIGPGSGLPGPTDAWITLAGLARETRTIRLGTLVSSATFRLPGPLAITVAQVDAMSGGRVELGLGAGWFADEHAAYGIPFPSTGERFDRLEEQLAVITGLWTTPEGEMFDHAGTRYPVQSSPALPKPVQRPHPPIIVGGRGRRRTPALAARYAAEFNLAFGPVEEFVRRRAAVTEACRQIGRDPATIGFSAALTVCCGRDAGEVNRRAASIGQAADALRADGIAGTPPEVTATVQRWHAAGAQRLFLQVLDLDDLDHLDLLAEVLADEVLGGGQRA
jgi:F420-dependent oxidoreductase-like protein